MKEDTILQDALVPYKYLYNEHNRAILIKNGVMKRDESWNDFRRKLFQLLLRPNKRVREEITSLRAAIHQRSISIAVHIRTGGLLANDCEGVSMVDQKTLETIPAQIETIRKLLTNNTRDVVVYLSSDSDKAIAYLQQHLNSNYLMIAASKHARGRTTGNQAIEDKVEGALLDLFVLSDCNALLTTQRSGFSTIAAILSRARVKQVIPVTRGTVNCKRKRS